MQRLVLRQKNLSNYGSVTFSRIRIRNKRFNRTRIRIRILCMNICDSVSEAGFLYVHSTLSVSPHEPAIH
jgi:hypothetical protein